MSKSMEISDGVCDQQPHVSLPFVGACCIAAAVGAVGACCIVTIVRSGGSGVRSHAIQSNTNTIDQNCRTCTATTVGAAAGCGMIACSFAADQHRVGTLGHPASYLNNFVIQYTACTTHVSCIMIVRTCRHMGPCLSQLVFKSQVTETTLSSDTAAGNSTAPATHPPSPAQRKVVHLLTMHHAHERCVARSNAWGLGKAYLMQWGGGRNVRTISCVACILQLWPAAVACSCGLPPALSHHHPCCYH